MTFSNSSFLSGFSAIWQACGLVVSASQLPLCFTDMQGRSGVPFFRYSRTEPLLLAEIFEIDSSGTSACEKQILDHKRMRKASKERWDALVGWYGHATQQLRAGSWIKHRFNLVSEHD